jgi:peptidoglycan/xylan/chitin deacetylase (PgdA/CDA1 family)
VPGHTADQHQGAVEAILAGGHEVGHHGYLHRGTDGLDAAAQRAELEEGLTARGKSGVRPGPHWVTSGHGPLLELTGAAGRAKGTTSLTAPETIRTPADVTAAEARVVSVLWDASARKPMGVHGGRAGAAGRTLISVSADGPPG